MVISPRLTQCFSTWGNLNHQEGPQKSHGHREIKIMNFHDFLYIIFQQLPKKSQVFDISLPSHLLHPSNCLPHEVHRSVARRAHDVEEGDTKGVTFNRHRGNELVEPQSKRRQRKYALIWCRIKERIDAERIHLKNLRPKNSTAFGIWNMEGSCNTENLDLENGGPGIPE